MDGKFMCSMILVRYTTDRPWFSDQPKAINFICKEFWYELFTKQIDNLKTNHRGTFVLQDNKFRWLSRLSRDPSVELTGEAQDPSAMSENKATPTTRMHLYFPCGLIRGALSTLGIPCAVSAYISNLPALTVFERGGGIGNEKFELCQLFISKLASSVSDSFVLRDQGAGSGDAYKAFLDYRIFVFFITSGTTSLYQSHPWVLVILPNGDAFGILADTTKLCEMLEIPYFYQCSIF
ncbi:trafficking protein particle complex subunit 6B [Tanacetum coccineum]